MSDGLTYLASPYTHDDAEVREMRYRQAAAYAAKLMLRGERVYSPIVHGHAIEQVYGSKMGGHDFWLPHCFAIMRMCARVKVLRLDGWEASKGIHDEVELAALCGITVLHVDP